MVTTDPLFTTNQPSFSITIDYRQQNRIKITEEKVESEEDELVEEKITYLTIPETIV